MTAVGNYVRINNTKEYLTDVVSVISMLVMVEKEF